MVTIFTPTFNRKKEIIILYESLLNQTDKDFEWIVVDDGSDDGTEELMTELKNKKNSKNEKELTFLFSLIVVLNYGSA